MDTILADDLQVGMGVTLFINPNCYPFTLIKIINDKRILVQEDKWTRIDKNTLPDRQVYEYMPNPMGKKYEVSLRKNGKWVPTGWNLNSERYFLFGARRRYDGTQR